MFILRVTVQHLVRLFFAVKPSEQSISCKQGASQMSCIDSQSGVNPAAVWAEFLRAQVSSVSRTSLNSLWRLKFFCVPHLDQRVSTTTCAMPQASDAINASHPAQPEGFPALIRDGSEHVGWVITAALSLILFWVFSPTLWSQFHVWCHHFLLNIHQR